MKSYLVLLPSAQSGNVIAVGNFVRVFGTIVKVLLLCDLVNKEPDKDAGQDALVQRGSNHVKHFVVNLVQFLQALQFFLKVRVAIVQSLRSCMWQRRGKLWLKESEVPSSSRRDAYQ